MFRKVRFSRLALLVGKCSLASDLLCVSGVQAFWSAIYLLSVVIKSDCARIGNYNQFYKIMPERFFGFFV